MPDVRKFVDIGLTYFVAPAILILHLSKAPAMSGRPLNTTARYPARGSSLGTANRRGFPLPWISATARRHREHLTGEWEWIVGLELV